MSMMSPEQSIEMMSPEGFINLNKEKTDEELIQLRNELIKDIEKFEQHAEPLDFWIMPSPITCYKMNLQYLAALCNYIASEYDKQIL